MSKLENNIFIRIGISATYYCMFAIAMKYLGVTYMIMFGFTAILTNQTLDKTRKG